MNRNPYAASAVQSENEMSGGLNGSPLRKIRVLAVLLIVTPFVFAWPVQYAIVNYGGGWLVTNDLDPDARAMHLGLVSIPIVISLSIISFFAASLLFWRGRWFRKLSVVLAVVFGILSIPSILLLGSLIWAYFKFR